LFRDEWFNIVCREDHRSFEWYCGLEEVTKVLRQHMYEASKSEGSNPLQMIHPGSGTSLLPLELRKHFLGSRHVVLDVSEVALDEMRQVHDKHLSDISGDSIETSDIEYQITDVLNPPLGFKDASFDVWIDKGFIDAVFAKETHEDNRVQARKLFDEAHRLLSSRSSILFVVTLAEDHSLQLILDNWTTDDHRWSNRIHIWELQPLSGEMLPFAVVLCKDEFSNREDKTLVWHNLDALEEVIRFDDNNSKTIFENIKIRIEDARHNFARTIAAQSESLKLHQLMATIEVKPFDAEVNMAELGSTIMAAEWRSCTDPLRVIGIVWRPFDTEGEEEAKFVDVVPIGYGIFKARLRCIIDSQNLDDLVDAIGEWEGDDKFEGVQSVDIDWTETVAVSNAMDIFSKME
jgi:translation elongation factor EF-1beta